MEKSNSGIFLSSFVSGLVFAAGLGISGMIQPHRVKAFLDVTGDWDPSLALVMGSAVGVYFLANELFANKVAKPVFAENWSHLPTPGLNLPLRAVIGNILFGAGWGLVGYCPAPALMSLASLHFEPYIFVFSMIFGFIFWEVWLRKVKLFAS
jgi:uncharacterized membrane protein YedE/YeeE